MRRDLRTGAAALLILTVVLGFGYSLMLTGISQAVFGNRADGSPITRDGQVVGSKLIGQDFAGPLLLPEPALGDRVRRRRHLLLQPRPEQPQARPAPYERVDAYLELEGPYNPGLTRSDVPPDAVMTSASGVDPQISVANAWIQANRVADERDMPVDDVLALIDDHTAGRGLGFLGEPGVNVLELNLALDGDESHEQAAATALDRSMLFAAAGSSLRSSTRAFSFTTRSCSLSRSAPS